MLANGKKKKKKKIIIVWNEVDKSIQPVRIASFPDCSCLQFLITCSMQKWRGKAWEKRVMYMMSGRHEGGHEGSRHEAIKGQCLTVVTHKPCIDQPLIYQKKMLY